MKNEKDILQQKLNKLLEELSPLIIAGAIGGADYCIRNNKEEDWLEYEKEAGNKRPCQVVASSVIEAMIDKATGFEEANEINLLKFVIWFVEGFVDGVNSDEELK